MEQQEKLTETHEKEEEDFLDDEKTRKPKGKKILKMRMQRER